MGIGTTSASGWPDPRVTVLTAPDCDRCGKVLDRPGALVFGPPGLLAPNAVEKLHVCFSCWPLLRSAVLHTDRTSDPESEHADARVIQGIGSQLRRAESDKT